MQTRSLLKAVILASTTAAVGVACAPAPGTCTDNTDCSFGQVCLADGVCALARGGGVDGGGGLPPMGGDAVALGGFVTTFFSTGRFDGRIGDTPVEVAEVQVNVYREGISAWFSKEGDGSKFVYLQSKADLATPGVRTVSTDLAIEVIQACDTDAAYDEFFPTWEVEVSPPREATADDPIIAEDTTTVTDVTVGVTGEGSDLTVTFALPVD